MTELKELLEAIASREGEMAQELVEISRIPSINPKMGGTGEYKRMQWIKARLEGFGLEVKCVEAADSSVSEGVRLNMYAVIPGTEDTGKTLWFISHADTVAPGDTKSWDSDPMEPVLKDGKVYGLGCEDNTQAVIAGLELARLMSENGLRIKCNIAFLFVSDEETGSKYGLHALVDKGLFRERDEAFVPDGGNAAGDFIEIAEKSQVWLRVSVTGKQGHAAMPQLGINACSVGMHLGVRIEDTLKREFDFSDPIFDPPFSTFELTQKFSNVESPNVLPGLDVFTLDMRILPKYTVDSVVERIGQLISECEEAHPGVKVTTEFVTRVDAPAPTPMESPVAKNLLTALKERGVDARCGGIGGGTCAAILRSKGIPAVVFSHVDDMCHQPNEYAVTANLVKDAQVFMAAIMKYA